MLKKFEVFPFLIFEKSETVDFFRKNAYNKEIFSTRVLFGLFAIRFFSYNYIFEIFPTSNSTFVTATPTVKRTRETGRQTPIEMNTKWQDEGKSGGN